MPRIQDSRNHVPSGLFYRYDADYDEIGGEARWSASVSIEGRRVVNLSGTAVFDAEDTPAFSAVVASVRAEIDKQVFSRGR